MSAADFHLASRAARLWMGCVLAPLAINQTDPLRMCLDASISSDVVSRRTKASSGRAHSGPPNTMARTGVRRHTRSGSACRARSGRCTPNGQRRRPGTLRIPGLCEQSWKGALRRCLLPGCKGSSDSAAADKICALRARPTAARGRNCEVGRWLAWSRRAQGRFGWVSTGRYVAPARSQTVNNLYSPVKLLDNPTSTTLLTTFACPVPPRPTSP